MPSIVLSSHGIIFAMTVAVALACSATTADNQGARALSGSARIPLCRGGRTPTGKAVLCARALLASYPGEIEGISLVGKGRSADRSRRHQGLAICRDLTKVIMSVTLADQVTAATLRRPAVRTFRLDRWRFRTRQAVAI